MKKTFSICFVWKCRKYWHFSIVHFIANGFFCHCIERRKSGVKLRVFYQNGLFFMVNHPQNELLLPITRSLWRSGRTFRWYFSSLPLKHMQLHHWPLATFQHIPLWAEMFHRSWLEKDKNVKAEKKGRHRWKGKIKHPRSSWVDLCSRRLICPLIPNCVHRWVRSLRHGGFAKRGLKPTADQPCLALVVGLWMEWLCLVYHRQRTMCTSHSLWQNIIVWTWLTGLMGLLESAKQTTAKWNTWALARRNNFSS